MVGSSFASATVATANVGVATEIFNGGTYSVICMADGPAEVKIDAGLAHSSVGSVRVMNSKAFAYSVCQYEAVLGSLIFVGTGSLVLINRQLVTAVVTFFSKNPLVIYTVGGTQVPFFLYFSDLFVSPGGIAPLAVGPDGTQIGKHPWGIISFIL